MSAYGLLRYKLLPPLAKVIGCARFYIESSKSPPFKKDDINSFLGISILIRKFKIIKFFKSIINVI